MNKKYWLPRQRPLTEATLAAHNAKHAEHDDPNELPRRVIKWLENMKKVQSQVKQTSYTYRYSRKNPGKIHFASDDARTQMFSQDPPSRHSSYVLYRRNVAPKPIYTYTAESSMGSSLPQSTLRLPPVRAPINSPKITEKSMTDYTGPRLPSLKNPIPSSPPPPS